MWAVLWLHLRSPVPTWVPWISYAVRWVPDLLYASIDQESPFDPPQEVDASSRSLGAVSPVSPPPSPGQLSPGGASVISTRSGRLSTAHCHLWCCKALSTGSGASRRRPAAAAASGSSLPAALARRRGSARAEPRLHVLPARQGVVIVGDTRALPLPVPARAPLLVRQIALSIVSLTTRMAFRILCKAICLAHCILSRQIALRIVLYQGDSHFRRIALHIASWAGVSLCILFWWIASNIFGEANRLAQCIYSYAYFSEANRSWYLCQGESPWAFLRSHLCWCLSPLGK